jgi:hypothetical protein
MSYSSQLNPFHPKIVCGDFASALEILGDLLIDNGDAEQ